MITIRPVYNDYKMLFSNPGSGWRGFSVMAKSIDEVHAAIDHHHNRKHDHTKCPLCRLQDKEAKSPKKGRRKAS